MNVEELQEKLPGVLGMAKKMGNPKDLISREAVADAIRTACIRKHIPFSSKSPEGLRVWIDAGRDTYDRQAAANQQNGKLGGRPKKANGFFLHGKAKAKAKDNTEGIAAAVAAAPSAPEAPPGSELPPLPPERYFVQQGFGTEVFAAKVLGEYRAKGCSDDLLIRCMDEALAYGFAKWGYVRSVLERCLREDIHDAAAFDASRQRRGTGHSTRVDRPTPSGNNFLADAVNRPFRSKRKD